MALRITTKGSYGLRAMMDLAHRNGSGPVLIATIAEDQGISAKYLHALLTALRMAGLVRSTRGSGGGYRLARAPVEITVGEVLRALEGPVALRDCLADGSFCERNGMCATQELWRDLSQLIDKELSKITLQDMIDRSCKLGGDQFLSKS